MYLIVYLLVLNIFSKGRKATYKNLSQMDGKQ